MKYFLLLFFVYSSSLLSIKAQSLHETEEVTEFGSNPGNLKMYAYNNLVNKDSSKKKLLVVLHGCSQTANDIAKLTGWNFLADEGNFTIIYPQQKLGNNLGLCFNWFKNGDNEKGKGECESINQMISYALKNYLVDSTKIFITGLSAGAVMAVNLLATEPSRFLNGAIFAGGAYKIANDYVSAFQAMTGKLELNKQNLLNNIVNQIPNYKGRKPSLIIYQGQKDNTVHPKNALALLIQWTAFLGCDTIPKKIEKKYKSIEDITRTEYCNEKDSPKIVFYSVENLGHKIMVIEKKNNQKRFKSYKGFDAIRNTAIEFELIKE